MHGTTDLITGASSSYLLAMPLHAITEVYGEAGLRDRWALELRKLSDSDRIMLTHALTWASDLHAGQRRTREPYANHLLRVAIRILCYYRITDAQVLAAALLHDSVEDHPWAMAGYSYSGVGLPPQREALRALNGRFGHRVARLVAAVTNPPDDPDLDRHSQYLEHVTTALMIEPWARVLKLSDFTDNGVGIVHSVGPKVHQSARKYEPVVPVLQHLLNLPDTPLEPDVKKHITAQLALARSRFAAILSD